MQATWVRNKRNNWEQTRPLMFAAQKMAEQQCGLSKEEAEKLIRNATAGKVASESVTEAHQEGRHFQTPRIKLAERTETKSKARCFRLQMAIFDSAKKVASDHMIDIATKKKDCRRT